jgi:hypothetical protein
MGISQPKLGAADQDRHDRGADGLQRSAARRARLQCAGPDLFNFDPHLWVYDKASGEMLAEMELPANATGSPITYMASGKPFIVFPVGGSGLVEELIAVSL